MTDKKTLTGMAGKTGMVGKIGKNGKPAPAAKPATTGKPGAPIADQIVFEDLFRQQGEAMRAMFAPLMPGTQQVTIPDPSDMQHWAMSAAKLQKMWLDFGAEKTGQIEPMLARFGDIGKWTQTFMSMAGQLPISQAETQAKLWTESMAMWGAVMGQFSQGNAAPALPRIDRRFADKRWHEQPAFALIHQTYLFLSEKLQQMADEAQGLSPERKEQLRFATKVVTDALSPANFPLSNPIVIEQAMATKGESLVKGAEHLLDDLRKGQLTHTDPQAFELGRNIAMTPGKVVHETPLFQLIQYSPTTDDVFEVPLVIFPPWINRFYILDLNPQKSFVRWAVAQGLSVFIVSWKSADASMADVVWDDYIRSQIEVIDHVRARLKVPAVHTIGYCVAGTTLAATLAILSRRGEAEKVASATFFTAQVDFEDAGELRNLITDTQVKTLENLSTDGYLDGRYMAAAFNALRGPDLIWNYVINNYLLGHDYPAFDLLHWNGDTTNLPAKWHKAYLCDLYRDNLLIVPDALEADGTPIDLRRIATPCYIQAGREDHIAPPQSVWKLTRQVGGSWRFVLAGSGHIAGVVNPPESGKYQYWLNPGNPGTLDDFISGAVETKGSWWPDWAEWIAERAPGKVPAKGKCVPGGKGDKVIEDAPGRYVQSR